MHQGRVSKHQNPKGSTVWRFDVDYTDPSTGKRKRRVRSGFKTKADATKALRAYLEQRDRGRPTGGRSPKLGEWLVDDWLPAISDTVKPSTAALYAATINAQVSPIIGAIRLADIDGAALNRLYRTLREQGLAPKTIKNVHSLLHRAFRDATRWGVLPLNPADAADPPRVAKSEPKTWTSDQLRTFLAHVEGDRLEALWRLLALTGMRRGEALGLRWGDFDAKGGTVNVAQQVTDYAGEITISEPKTPGSRRQVVLDSHTVAVLQAHRKRQLEERVAWGAGYEDHDLIFCRENGTPLRPATVTRNLTALAEDAHLPRLTPHGLRHSWATLALKRGIHPKVVADRLGHSSVSVTLDRYSHVTASLDADAAEQVAAMIDGPA
jgi:integrase